MKLFSECTRCPKCRHNVIHAFFKKAENVYNASFQVERVILEHITRRCDRCSYSWNEATLDVAQEGKKDE